MLQELVPWSLLRTTGAWRQLITAETLSSARWLSWQQTLQTPTFLCNKIDSPKQTKTVKQPNCHALLNLTGQTSAVEIRYSTFHFLFSLFYHRMIFKVSEWSAAIKCCQFRLLLDTLGSLWSQLESFLLGKPYLPHWNIIFSLLFNCTCWWVLLYFFLNIYFLINI